MRVTPTLLLISSAVHALPLQHEPELRKRMLSPSEALSTLSHSHGETDHSIVEMQPMLAGHSSTSEGRERPSSSPHHSRHTSFYETAPSTPLRTPTHTRQSSSATSFAPSPLGPPLYSPRHSRAPSGLSISPWRTPRRLHTETPEAPATPRTAPDTPRPSPPPYLLREARFADLVPAPHPARDTDQHLAWLRRAYGGPVPRGTAIGIPVAIDRTPGRSPRAGEVDLPQFGWAAHPREAHEGNDLAEHQAAQGHQHHVDLEAFPARDPAEALAFARHSVRPTPIAQDLDRISGPGPNSISDRKCACIAASCAVAITGLCAVGVAFLTKTPSRRDLGDQESVSGFGILKARR